MSNQTQSSNYQNIELEPIPAPRTPSPKTAQGHSYQNTEESVPQTSAPPPSPSYTKTFTNIPLEDISIAPAHPPSQKGGPPTAAVAQAPHNNIPSASTSHRYTVFSPEKIKKDSLTPNALEQGGGAALDKPPLVHPKDNGDEEEEDLKPISYLAKGQGLEDIPSWPATVGLGFQVYLMMVATSVSLPIYIMKKMCMPPNEPLRANLVSTFVFVSGIVTILQSSFGTRLPIVQGGSSAFLVPTLAILALPQWKCPEQLPDGKEGTELWQKRMREVQGAIIIASLFQVAIGFCGLVGIILRWLTPITIACSVSMIGLSLFGIAGEPAGTNWWISVSTIILIIIFSQYLRDIHVPIPFTRSPKREGMKRYQIFQRLPILLGMLVMWLICLVLTLTDILPVGDPARTDLENYNYIRENSPWFAVPSPFQWGSPTFTVGAIFGVLAGVISGIVESIGDYYATAKIVGARAPPIHAINRGVFVEGIGCIIAGMWGTGNGTTSYSENIGAIGITQIGSRRVIQIGGLLMIIFSLFCKLNAAFVTIPSPIVGAFLIVIFGTLTAAGISNLKGVDLMSPRNMFVIGFSIFLALTVSQWMDMMQKKHIKVINTGSLTIDITLTVFLSTGMFLGGAVAFILDNTVPGSKKERGLEDWELHFCLKKSAERETVDTETGLPKIRDDSYDLPFIMQTLHNSELSKWFPILPTFEPEKYTNIVLGTFGMRKVFNFSRK